MGMKIQEGISKKYRDVKNKLWMLIEKSNFAVILLFLDIYRLSH